MKTISFIDFLKLFIILSNTYQQLRITFGKMWIKVYNSFAFQPQYHYYLYNYANNQHTTHNNKQLYTICAQLNTIPTRLDIIPYNIYTSSSNILQLRNNYDYCATLSYFVPLLSYITIIIMIILHTIVYYYTLLRTYNNSSTYNMLLYDYITYTILYILYILYIIMFIFHAIIHNCIYYSNKIVSYLYNYSFNPAQIERIPKLSDNLHNCLYNFLELIWQQFIAEQPIHPYCLNLF